MTFWIILGVIALIVAIGIIYSVGTGDSDGIPNTIGVVVLVAIIGAFVVGAGAWQQSGGEMQLQKTWALRALVTKTQTESNASATFFLGFGSASSSTSDVRSIAYIRTAKDGGSTLQKTTIDNAVIYEDGDSKPYVEDWVKIGHNNGAFWPWDFTYQSGDVQHRFHIPKGSILENYEVTP